MASMPTAVSAMTPMPTVHEHVHQRTSENKQPRQKSEDVGPMLGKKQCAAYCQKGQKYESASRGPEATPCAGLVMQMLVVCHVTLLIQR
jgi:hypothetical protein